MHIIALVQHRLKIASICFNLFRIYYAREIAIAYKLGKLAISTAFIFVVHCVRDSIRTDFSILTRRRVQRSLATTWQVHLEDGTALHPAPCT